MSASTWKKEFYSTPADEVRGKIRSIRHSLKKWKGLRKEALEKHGLVSPPIIVDDITCALCVNFIDYYSDCDDCPLAQTLGGTCDESEAPYWIYQDRRDPEPMIKALEQTLKNNCKKRG